MRSKITFVYSWFLSILTSPPLEGITTSSGENPSHTPPQLEGFKTLEMKNNDQEFYEGKLDELDQKHYELIEDLETR